ncbi:MAG: hypothetical protein J2P18_20595 [Nocardia sp.]|nr:hypothetical protein [Nocardia sp.]
MKQKADRDETTGADEPAPGTVRAAGLVAALEGLAGVIIAIVLVVQGLTAHHGNAASAYGTAAWFAILAGAILAAGIGLLRGKRWGRAIVVIAGILLLPVAWYMFRSHRLELAVPVAVLAIVTLGLIFAPPSLRWFAAAYDTTG